MINGNLAETGKIFKINYTLNLLPRLGEHYYQDPKTDEYKMVTPECSLMELCGATEELDIFECPALTQVIDFKWDAYARNFMYMGCFFHFFYLFTIMVYVVEIYVRG